jgi:SAM-dependent methyltransferase
MKSKPTLMFRSIKKQVRKIGLAIKLYELWIYRTRKIYINTLQKLKGKSGIEVGGPSQIFSETGPIPLYRIIDSLDNINYSNKTFWSSIDAGNNFSFSSNKKNGKQIIADAIDLSQVLNESYDFLLASHVIEHIANPIKAVLEWKRIVRKGGLLVIVAPDRRKTYDRKRPLTTIDHVITDFKQNMTESDSTHFAEVRDLHDLTMDSTVSNIEEHIDRTNRNLETRIVHHHTFDVKLLTAIMEFCGLQIIDDQVFNPYHIVVVGRKID